MLLGIDIGTSSSKGVAVSESGEIVAIETRPHETSRPAPGWFEHDPDSVWWDDTCDLIRRLLAATERTSVGAVCISGIGPCALVTDERDRPLRPGILYGIDTRAAVEIAEIAREIDEASLREHAGNTPTTQSVGPKLRWIARHDPDAWNAARRLYSASSFIVERLTGEYVMDHYTASASDPLYDLLTHDWWARGWGAAAARLEPPRLAWPGEIVGMVTPAAAAATGLSIGTPVLAGTIDAMADSYSVGCRDIGDAGRGEQPGRLHAAQLEAVSVRRKEGSDRRLEQRAEKRQGVDEVTETSEPWVGPRHPAGRRRFRTVVASPGFLSLSRNVQSRHHLPIGSWTLRPYSILRQHFSQII